MIRLFARMIVMAALLAGCGDPNYQPQDDEQKTLVFPVVSSAR